MNLFKKLIQSMVTIILQALVARLVFRLFNRKKQSVPVNKK
ncbi:hypothetical protein [uncultured Limosilactobacillus sp.]|nr:hypothetical protein [uncultured Limosilactobacillus sp.]